MLDWQVMAGALPDYASASVTTLGLLAAALAIGLAAAVPLAVLRARGNAWVAWPVRGFTFVIRGTPLLVQLFLIYYGLAQFEAVRASAAWPLLSSAWFCAMLAFAVNTCAYTVEILAGSLAATPAGEVEAALAMGLGRAQRYRWLLLPSMFRRALPAYSNEVVMMLHGTSIASVVTLVDLTAAAREVNARFYLPFEAFLLAAAFYLAITFVLVGAFRLAERRWLAPFQPR